MIGYNLKTKQTTGDGVTVNKVYTYTYIVIQSYRADEPLTYYEHSVTDTFT